MVAWWRPTGRRPAWQAPSLPSPDARLAPPPLPTQDLFGVWLSNPHHAFSTVPVPPQAPPDPSLFPGSVFVTHCSVVCLLCACGLSFSVGHDLQGQETEKGGRRGAQALACVTLPDTHRLPDLFYGGTDRGTHCKGPTPLPLTHTHTPHTRLPPQLLPTQDTYTYLHPTCPTSPTPLPLQHGMDG